MVDGTDLIQEKLDKKKENDVEYQRMLAAYIDNPFHDLTKDSIKEYVDKKSPEEKNDAAPEEI